MDKPQMGKILKSILVDGGFGFEIIVYDDATEVIYFEEGENGAPRSREDKFCLAAGHDLIVLEEAISLRKAYDQSK